MMKLIQTLLNTVFLLIGVIISAFLPWASIGSPEALKQAAEAEPYKIFFLRTFVAIFILGIYTGLIYGLNRLVFRKTNVKVVFLVSMIIYCIIIVIFVYLFIQDSLKPYPPIN